MLASHSQPQFALIKVGSAYLTTSSTTSPTPKASLSATQAPTRPLFYPTTLKEVSVFPLAEPNTPSPSLHGSSTGASLWCFY